MSVSVSMVSHDSFLYFLHVVSISHRLDHIVYSFFIIPFCPIHMNSLVSTSTSQDKIKAFQKAFKYIKPLMTFKRSGCLCECSQCKCDLVDGFYYIEKEKQLFTFAIEHSLMEHSILPSIEVQTRICEIFEDETEDVYHHMTS